MRARRSVFGRLATGIVCVILAGCGSRSAAIPNSQAHQAWAADLAVRGESGSTAGYKPAIAPAWIGGELYGMTLKGAAHDYGSVYGVTSTGKAFPLSSFSVHSIMEQPVTSLNGVLYGSVTFSYADKNGSVFGIDRKTGKQVLSYNFQAAPDASLPGALVDVGGMLYATSESGGTNAAGTIFSIDPSNGQEHLLYSFQGAVDGRYPMPVLANAGGVLFGTTKDGGANNAGAIFSFDTQNGTFTLVYTFGSSNPEQSNLAYVNGKVFGDYASGPASGTLFSVDPTNDAVTPLSTNAELSQLIAGGGNLYGLDPSGGTKEDGEIVKVDQTSGTFSNVYYFPSIDLAPSGLTFANGKFYSGGFPPGTSPRGAILEFGQGYQKTLYKF